MVPKCYRRARPYSIRGWLFISLRRHIGCGGGEGHLLGPRAVGIFASFLAVITFSNSQCNPTRSRIYGNFWNQASAPGHGLFAVYSTTERSILVSAFSSSSS
jgi:hypothetical protein